MNAADEALTADAQLANTILDKIIATQGLKNDAALGRALDTKPPVISKVRHGRLRLGDTLIVRIHELTGWPVRQIKAQLNRPCICS
jgi:hypothetical protein